MSGFFNQIDNNIKWYKLATLGYGIPIGLQTPQVQINEPCARANPEPGLLAKLAYLNARNRECDKDPQRSVPGFATTGTQATWPVQGQVAGTGSIALEPGTK